MKYLFESDRLGFRLWEEKDFNSLYKICRNKNVMRYFPKTLTEEETREFFNKIEKHFIEKGYGLWAVELKTTRELIGFIGLLEASFKADFTPCIEIGWRLDDEYWGKGYGREGAKRVLEYGFNELALEEIYSFTAKINIPSENLMKSIGMKKLKEFNHPKVEKGHPLESHVLYRIGKNTRG